MSQIMKKTVKLAGSPVRRVAAGVLLLTLLTIPAVAGGGAAYADSITITIDKPTVNLDIAARNVNGTFSKSAASTVSVKTTNSTGYTLGIRSSGSEPNKLINSSDSDTTTNHLTSITSSTTIDQFKALAATTLNGKWGYMPSRYCTGDTSSTCSNNTDTFFKAPTTGDTLDITETANPTTANTYELALGARIDSTQKLGAYNNTYVIYADANAIPYSIVYDDNVVSNMPADVNSGQATGGSVAFSSNVPVRSGYKFLGWCTVATSDPATATSDCATAGGTYYAAGATTTIAAATNFHLYAMWGEIQTIQAFATSGTCSTMSSGDTATVVDSRDGEEYLVGKLADNKCWMLDNLRLNPATATLNTSNTNMNASVTPTYTNTTSGFTSYTAAQFNANYKDDTTTSYGSGSGKVGVYYNYCAASAGTICTSSNSSNASYDICPAGWRMPTGGSSGEYQALYTAYSSNATNFRNALSTPLSGYFYNSSQFDLGGYGYFWSSTRRNNTSMYYLYVDSSDVNPQNDFGRSGGSSVRCVAK